MSGGSWQGLARTAEELGYSTILTGDHLGMPSTMARLVSAADATTALRVGTFVLNNDFHHPLRLAQEAATVDGLTGGRLEFGIGSGWARAEYAMLRLAYHPPAVRAAHLEAALSTIKQAWAGSVDGFRVPSALLPWQRPNPPVLVGGQSDAVLAVAARQAETVAFTGMTLRDGGFRPTGDSLDAVCERVEYVRSVAGERFDRLEFNVHLDAVSVVNRSESLVDKIASLRGVDSEHIQQSPFALVGCVEQIVDKLYAIRERAHISYYAVPHGVMASFASVVARLTGR